MVSFLSLFLLLCLHKKISVFQIIKSLKCPNLCLENVKLNSYDFEQNYLHVI